MAKFKAGDRVKFKDNDNTGVVDEVSGKAVLVKLDSGKRIACMDTEIILGVGEAETLPTPTEIPVVIVFKSGAVMEGLCPADAIDEFRKAAFCGDPFSTKKLYFDGKDVSGYTVW